MSTEGTTILYGGRSIVHWLLLIRSHKLDVWFRLVGCCGRATSRVYHFIDTTSDELACELETQYTRIHVWI